MITKIKDLYINTDYVSMLAVKDSTLVIDFSYSKNDGPVFLAFDFTTPEDAQSELDRIVAFHNPSNE